jgi:tRNA-splicing ligase RtcB (3'-phosphate/5'-hydroxy nucleic acid ligase)
MLPIMSWCKNGIEDGAMDQISNLREHPALFHHVALMPDCHQGYGMPIGGVIACKGSIIPNAVGVDIGCGMCFVKTDIPTTILYEIKDKQGRNLIKDICDIIHRNIPLGFDKHKQPQDWVGFESAPLIPIIQDNIDNARLSLGTLGGGNHFIELQKDEKDNLCLMLHSGSRNLGKQICDHFNKIAEEQCDTWFYSKCVEDQLAFLPVHSNEGDDYITAMNFALDFAHENRRVMMEKVKNITFNVIEKYAGSFPIKILQEVNAHHNYAALENHFGENVWVHRKGAIRARKNDIGIIPGSMGTSSYITIGRENPDSFHSCSHGAGRKMGRKEANRVLTQEEVNKSLEGIEHSKMKGNFSEAPGAYKDIEDVMKNQEDLVVILSRLKPIGVVKGE